MQLADLVSACSFKEKEKIAGFRLPVATAYRVGKICQLLQLAERCCQQMNLCGVPGTLSDEYLAFYGVPLAAENGFRLGVFFHRLDEFDRELSARGGQAV